MTSRNIRLKIEQNGFENAEKVNKPFLLRPAAKDYLWGGRRLDDEFDKGIQIVPLAETWECSTHPDGCSKIIGGMFSGRTLKEVLSAHPEFLGEHVKMDGEFPLLIKFIDAEKDLSVQVHPDDTYARANEHGQPGKSEMWYILDARKDAQLIYGLYHDTEKETLRKSIEEGTIEKYLQKISVEKDDVFYINAGTIHAIGAGILLVEVQQNSNLTYRLYDYDRTDQNGNKRELHIDKALEVADLKGAVKPMQPMRVLKYRQGCASELLCRCKYFEVYRMMVNTERYRNMVEYRADNTSFRVLLCIKGCGTIIINEEETMVFFKGDCIFFPADSADVRIHGNAQFLDVHC